MRSFIILTVTILSSSCTNKDIQTNIEDMNFEYIVSRSGVDECPEDGCGDDLELSMCAFASNLGTLAILENIGDLESYEEEQRCGSIVARSSVRVRVLEHIAGERLPSETTLNSITFGRHFNTPEEISLIQLHKFENRYQLISSMPIIRESFIRDEGFEQLRNEEEQVLPNTIRELREEASRIASAPEECTNFPRRTEQFWNDVYHGVCTD